LRVPVSGHSGTGHAGRRKDGEVACGVLVPVDDQAAGVAVAHPDVQRQLAFAAPQSEQVLAEGYQRSAVWITPPDQPVL
jgi:hypothetical protein